MATLQAELKVQETGCEPGYRCRWCELECTTDVRNIYPNASVCVRFASFANLHVSVLRLCDRHYKDWCSRLPAPVLVQ